MNKKITIISILIFALLVLGFCYYFFNLKKVNIQADSSGVTLSLSPDRGTYNIGDKFLVKIELDTAGQTVSEVDVNTIHYDPSVLEVQGGSVEAGSIFSDYPTNTVDPAGGKINIIAKAPTGYSGSGVFATINFKAIKASSSTNLSYDFSSGSNSDCNVLKLDDGTDILSSVQDAKFTIVNQIPLPTIDLKANNVDGPISINYNQTVDLSWTSANAVTCLASNGWIGTKTLTGSEVSAKLIASKVFTLTCQNETGQVSDSVTINVNGQPVAKNLSVSLRVNDSKSVTIAPNSSVTLSWASDDAKSCKATEDWSGNKSTSGKQIITNITSNKKFKLICQDNSDSVSSEVAANIDNSIVLSTPSQSPLAVVSQQSVPITPPSVIAQNIKAPTVSPTKAASVPTLTLTPIFTPAAMLSVDNITRPANPTAIYKGGVVDGWSMWLFYVVIPIFVTSGLVYLFIIRQKKSY